MEIEEKAANGLDVGGLPFTAGSLHCLPCSALSYPLFFSCEFLAPPLCGVFLMSCLALFFELGLAEVTSIQLLSCLIRRASAGVALQGPKQWLELALGSHCLTVPTGTLMGFQWQSLGTQSIKSLLTQLLWVFWRRPFCLVCGQLLEFAGICICGHSESGFNSIGSLLEL